MSGSQGHCLDLCNDAIGTCTAWENPHHRGNLTPVTILCLDLMEVTRKEIIQSLLQKGNNLIFSKYLMASITFCMEMVHSGGFAARTSIYKATRVFEIFISISNPPSRLNGIRMNYLQVRCPGNRFDSKSYASIEEGLLVVTHEQS